MALDGKTAARAGKKQEEIFAEKIHTVGGAEGAVEEPRVIAQDGRAAELQGTHRGQDAFFGDCGEGPLDQLRD